MVSDKQKDKYWFEVKCIEGGKKSLHMRFITSPVLLSAVIQGMHWANRFGDIDESDKVEVVCYKSWGVCNEAEPNNAIGKRL